MRDKEDFTRAELKRAAMKAFDKCMDSLANEPSITVIGGNAITETDCPVNEIADWLFRRRRDDGNTGN